MLRGRPTFRAGGLLTCGSADDINRGYSSASAVTTDITDSMAEGMTMSIPTLCNKSRSS
jgi:hypothetical protein